jgi:hypothetical protein
MIPPEYVEAIIAVLKDMELESPFRLRGWGKYVRAGEQYERAITAGVCERLRSLQFNSTPEKPYPNGMGSCDIVFNRPEGPEVWIEAKLYYTYYFDDSDETYSNPKPSYSDGHWQNQIYKLVADDCRGKLLKMSPATEVAGLLLGFEIQNLGPSGKQINRAIRSEVSENLSGWRVRHLSDRDGWIGTVRGCWKYKFVTRAMLLTPS